MSQPVLQLYTLSRPLSLRAVLRGLETMPARLRETVSHAPRDRMLHSPAPGEWSAFMAVCHMRDAALVYGMRFRWMVFDDDPLLPNYDEDRWVERSLDTIDDLSAILEEVAAARTGLIRMLSRPTPEQWQRTGRHEIAGPVVLEPYVRHQLAHEEMHLAQIRRALTP